MAAQYNVIYAALPEALMPAVALPLATAGSIAVAIGVAGVVARKALNDAEDPLVPDAGFSVRNVFEIFAGFMIWLGDSAMGKENRRYLPFASVLFFYIFSLNLIGLVPGFLMPTDQFQFNLGMALVVFALYNYWGIKEVGVSNYIKHLFGGSQLMSFPLIFVGMMIFVVELVGHVFRPITLSLRLFGNMTGDHLLLDAFVDLTKFIVPVPFYIFGTLVCFMQAFIFTLLSMVYIRFAVAHEDDH